MYLSKYILSLGIICNTLNSCINKPEKNVSAKEVMVHSIDIISLSNIDSSLNNSINLIIDSLFESKEFGNVVGFIEKKDKKPLSHFYAKHVYNEKYRWAISLKKSPAYLSKYNKQLIKIDFEAINHERHDWEMCYEIHSELLLNKNFSIKILKNEHLYSTKLVDTFKINFYDFDLPFNPKDDKYHNYW